MSEGTLDDRYFEWLYREIGSVRNRNPAKSYWRLGRQLYITPFLWSVPNDDNRIEDGLELREEFLESEGSNIGRIDHSWLALQCSMLEMLIALSRRASFEADGTTGDWFWLFMQNLQFRGFTDSVYSVAIEREVARTLERVIERKYDASGTGGLFPLRQTSRDQRQVELWYQMSSYIIEGHYLDHAPLV